MDFELITHSFTLRLLYACIAVLVSYYILRLLDKLGNIDFKEVMENVKKDAQASSTYFSARIIAVSIIISQIFS